MERIGNRVSLILIFFVMSMAGWLWEVVLYLIDRGEWVNRGFLHGPWLPVYGAGSVMILVLLRGLKKKRAVEFVAIVFLCGVVEYSVSWGLELIYGKRWWDYSGWFLNLNGRICVEGLLAFGVGGMILVYGFVPILERMLRRIPQKLLVLLCLVLTLLFGVDLICSVPKPNAGRGITAAAKKETVREGGGIFKMGGNAYAGVIPGSDLSCVKYLAVVSHPQVAECVS